MVEKNKKIEQKLKDNKQNIAKLYQDQNSAAMTHTALVIKLGKLLNSQKLLVGKYTDATWNDYRQKNFSYISERNDQRYRRLAKYLDTKKHAALLCMSVENLEEVIQRLEEINKKNEKKNLQLVTIDDVFEKYGIKSDEKLDTPKDISLFKKQLTEMLTDFRKDSGFLLVGVENQSERKVANRRLVSKQEKILKKKLSRNGMVKLEEIEESISRAGMKLLNNINAIFHKKKKIYCQSSTKILYVKYSLIADLTKILRLFEGQKTLKLDDEKVYCFDISDG